MRTGLPPHERRRSYRRHQLLSLVAAVLAGSGATATTLSLAPAPAATLSATAPAVPVDVSPSRAPAPESSALPLGITPVRLTIPALGLDARVAPVGLDEAGALEVPSDFGVAGWYSGAPRPGDPGPAVMAGHVDSHEGPAVFFRLRDVEAQDRAVVEYSDGRSVEFRVYHRAEYSKESFPTAAVYANTQNAELRLITCGGPFDRSSRRYANNVIVWARAG